MRGLRTQETDKFIRFFTVVQAEAKKHGAVFFADAGDGNDFETPEMECENMMGWLIPTARVEEFEPLWASAAVDDSWTEFFVWAVWSFANGAVKVMFRG